MKLTRTLAALVFLTVATVPGVAAGQAGDGNWALGEPDLVVEMPVAYTLAAGDRVVTRNFVLPVELSEQRWVRAFDLRPAAGAGDAVQRAEVLLDMTGAGETRDERDAEVGYSGALTDHGVLPAGHVLAWSAAGGALPAVPGLAWPLLPGANLLLQLQMQAGGTPVNVQASVGLYFADDGPLIAAVTVPMEAAALDIPAGVAEHATEDRYRLPVAVDVVGAYPQMGPLGSQIHVSAMLPDGTATDVLRIDEWQPDELVGRRYTEPIHLPAQSTLIARFVFDNSAGNPRNPSDPPARAGYVTTDPGGMEAPERGEVVLQVLPVLPGDTALLAQNLGLKRARNDLLSLQARLRFAPDDYRSHGLLAARYIAMGQPELARPHVDEALALQPEHPEAHFNLGSLLIAEGDHAGAIDAFRMATELRPEYADAHNNLGALLAATGALTDAVVYYRLALQFRPRDASAHFNLASTLLALGEQGEAITHYREALVTAPTDPSVHSNLARVLANEGEPAEAVTHYERALEFAPDLPMALVGLAWIRATSPYESLRQADQALALAQRAVALIGADHPEVLDALAAAYAATGRFDDAVATARRAVDAARANPGFEPLANSIEGRIRLYLAFRPFRTPLPEEQ